MAVHGEGSFGIKITWKLNSEEDSYFYPTDKERNKRYRIHNSSDKVLRVIRVDR